MLSKKVEKMLNEQIEIESNSSYAYLAMASWCEVNGMEGASSFFYKQSDEERVHMLKLFRYINERGGHAITPVIAKAKLEYKTIVEVIQTFYNSEKKVTDAVSKLVYIADQEKDYTTLNFLQWYVQEQYEEETLARTIQDKIKLIGTSGNGPYLIDNEIGSYANAKKETANTFGKEEKK